MAIPVPISVVECGGKMIGWAAVRSKSIEPGVAVVGRCTCGSNFLIVLVVLSVIDGRDLTLLLLSLS